MSDELMSFEDLLRRQANWVCGFYNSCYVMPHARCIKRLEDLLVQSNQELNLNPDLISDANELMRRMWNWVNGIQVLDQATFKIRKPEKKKK